MQRFQLQKVIIKSGMKGAREMEKLLKRYPELTVVSEDIEKAVEMLTDMYKNGGKLLCCGNGGSASDSEHIVGELMKSFKIKRPIKKELCEALAQYGDEGVALSQALESTLPAISLTGHVSLSTAYGNDKNMYMVFAQQVNGFGNKGDTLLALTTSGNSKNCIYAAIVAKAKGMKVIGITGKNDSKLSSIADICIKLPEIETYLVQELTLPVYHYICSRLEKIFFS